MKMFILGMLSFWVFLAVVTTIADQIGRLDSDIYQFFCIAPLIAISLIPMLFFIIIIRPWRNVWKPVERKRFEAMVLQATKPCKTWRIGSRFYVCWDSEARLVNKLFFVLIAKAPG